MANVTEKTLRRDKACEAVFDKFVLIMQTFMPESFSDKEMTDSMKMLFMPFFNNCYQKGYEDGKIDATVTYMLNELDNDTTD